MVYFSFYELLKYLLNSIKYFIYKHFKIFTIILLVFIIAFLFGSQSKAVDETPNLPNFDSLTQNKYYLIYKIGDYYRLLSSSESFGLEYLYLNGEQWIVAYNVWGDIQHGYWHDGTFDYWENGAGHYTVYMTRSTPLINNPSYKYSNFDIYAGNEIAFHANPYIPVVNPSIETSSADIEDWSFNNLVIDGGSINPFYSNEGASPLKVMNLVFDYNNRHYVRDITPFVQTSLVNNNYTFDISIPKDFFNNILYMVTSSTLDLKLEIFNDIDSDESDIYNLGTFNVSISSDLASDINNTAEKDIQSDILDEQQKTNQNLNNLNNSINDLNSSITDSNVDNSLTNDISGLSSGFNATDNTGIDQLFQMVYNAFCVNEIEYLTFTIPFTNKQVSINNSNVSSKFPQDVKILVGIFVWGYVGLFVLKDIRGMINKISEGSPEDVGSDVKKEVL